LGVSLFMAKIHIELLKEKIRFTLTLESKPYKNNSKALQNLKDEARIKEQFITLEFFILNRKYFFGLMYI
jgi:hypothetical protein